MLIMPYVLYYYYSNRPFLIFGLFQFLLAFMFSNKLIKQGQTLPIRTEAMVLMIP